MHVLFGCFLTFATAFCACYTWYFVGANEGEYAFDFFIDNTAACLILVFAAATATSPVLHANIASLHMLNIMLILLLPAANIGTRGIITWLTLMIPLTIGGAARYLSVDHLPGRLEHPVRWHGPMPIAPIPADLFPQG